MFSFRNLPNPKTGEKIVIFLRRHWFVFFLSVVTFVVFFSMPIILAFIFQSFWPDLLESNIALALVTLLMSAYYLSIWLFLFHSFVDYFLDVWVVTNKRIVNIEQRGIFARTISEVEIDRVQDITSDVKGIFPTLLKYGDVHVQSAATQKRFVFKQVPNPGAVAKKIARIVAHLEAKNGVKPRIWKPGK